MYFIKQKILHNINVSITSDNLRSMASKLGQWCLLKPRVIIRTTIKLLTDLKSVVGSLLLFKINGFYIAR